MCHRHDGRFVHHGFHLLRHVALWGPLVALPDDGRPLFRPSATTTRAPTTGSEPSSNHLYVSVLGSAKGTTTSTYVGDV